MWEYFTSMIFFDIIFEAKTIVNWISFVYITAASMCFKIDVMLLACIFLHTIVFFHFLKEFTILQSKMHLKSSHEIEKLNRLFILVADMSPPRPQCYRQWVCVYDLLAVSEAGCWKFEKWKFPKSIAQFDQWKPEVIFEVPEEKISKSSSFYHFSK